MLEILYKKNISNHNNILYTISMNKLFAFQRARLETLNEN